MVPQQAIPEQPALHRESPSPPNSPLAISAYPELSRSVSATSNGSAFSNDTSTMGRDSLGSTASSAGTSVSRSSSASYTTRKSMDSNAKSNRRGYVKPQGTTFAKSAQSRESVLSLGSIAHLQYYFARTGLLDGKGGRLARKKGNQEALDLSAMDTSFLSLSMSGSETDSYASIRGSPEMHAQWEGRLVESPLQEDYEYYSEDDEEHLDNDHPHMLPPTVSTYNQREKPIERPPTLDELKLELHKSLKEAAKVLEESRTKPETPSSSPNRSNTSANEPSSPSNPASEDMRGWHELQGMHILDIMTLAIRAAKMYYTAHDQPARLSAIKSERKIRADLLSVMDVLRRMATRNFAAGMRIEEREIMENWVISVYAMLKQEEAMEESEKQLRASWIWLDDSWSGSSEEREYAFIKSMDPEASTLPALSTVDATSEGGLPTLFLNDLRTGLRLVQLHNAVVKKSKRPFGQIDKWHTDFGKPYRCAENLRYWIKAAELRWEVVLKVDVTAVVSGSTDRAVWKGFEDAVWAWCNRVRQEITKDLRI